ncbi:MAG: putative binding protein [Euryarchaeota archaeon]|nr:putative binding protein [Euryarchaeota archaeon]
MKLAVLFSGGKDSVFACRRALEKDQVACLITMVSTNPDSYMFHTPNIRRTDLQAEAMGIPLLAWPTHGRKEDELDDLTLAISAAKDRYAIEGIVTGAIDSVYQAARVQKICRDLDLWCYCPIWQTNQLDYLRLLLKEGFSVIISGVYAYPFDAEWLGASLTFERIDRLAALQKKYKINPSGEGGELETFVLDSPIFKKRIEILKSSCSYANYRGHFVIEDMRLVDKSMDNGFPETDKEFEGSDDLADGACQSCDGVILLVDLCSVPDSLSHYEFVHPIRDALNELGCSTRVLHYSQVTERALDACERIILCGTALKDMGYAEHLEALSWIRCQKKPILGICAGMQAIAAVYGGSIVPHPQIGMVKMEILRNSPLLGEPHFIEGYHLHNYSATLPNGFELISGNVSAADAFFHPAFPTFGIAFHPEVRCRWILERFVSLANFC